MYNMQNFHFLFNIRSETKVELDLHAGILSTDVHFVKL